MSNDSPTTHLLDLTTPSRPRTIDWDRAHTDLDYRRTLGLDVPPRPKTTKPEPQGIRLTIEDYDRKVAGHGYSIKLRIKASDRDGQAIFDWAYERFGLDYARWSLTGSDELYFRDRADAEAVVAKFSPLEL